MPATPSTASAPGAYVGGGALWRWGLLPLAVLLLGDLWVVWGYLPDTVDGRLVGNMAAQAVVHGLGVAFAFATVLGIVRFPFPSRLLTRLHRGWVSVATLGFVGLQLDAIAFTGHWTLAYLHGVGVLGAFLIVVLGILRPGFLGTRRRWMGWIGVPPLVVLALTIVAFGTTLSPLTPKYLKEPVLFIITYSLVLYFLGLCWIASPSSRKAAVGLALVGVLGWVACVSLAPWLSQRSTFAVARSTEGTRSVRALNRRLAQVLGLGAVPWVQPLVGPDGDRRLKSGTSTHEGECRRTGEGRARSVLLVSIDALRADLYGHAWSDLPNLDRIRRRGVRFSRAMQTTSGTAGSMFSLHTGRYTLAPSPLRDAWEALERDLGYAQMTRLQSTADAEDLTHALMEDMARHRGTGTPFLLHGHYLSLHLPPGMGRLDWDYGAILQRLDLELGRWVDHLDRHALWNEVVLIVTADHGEELRHERGYASHGYGVTQTLLHVPLIVAAPGLEPMHVSRPVSSVDVLPTLLALLGVECGYPMDGVPLLPSSDRARALYGSSMSPTPALGPIHKQILYSDIHAVWVWPWKLVFNRGENAWALYDLQSDPKERDNLVDRRPAMKERLAPVLLRYARGEPPAPFAPPSEPR